MKPQKTGAGRGVDQEGAVVERVQVGSIYLDT
jgi:hypothetical protein